MAAISTEQALQLPQQLRRQGEQGAADSASNGESGGGASGDKRFLSDEKVSIRLQQLAQPVKKVAVDAFKSELGQDQSYIRETLRNKLAEYKLSPHTPLNLSKDAFGQLELKGPAIQSSLDQIATDLNNSLPFKQAFDRVSQQQPTLNYVDNVVKLSQAYGVSNSLFNSLISEEAEYNGLNDIAHRYQALKANAPQPEEPEALGSGRFEFSVNV